MIDLKIRTNNSSRARCGETPSIFRAVKFSLPMKLRHTKGNRIFKYDRCNNYENKIIVVCRSKSAEHMLTVCLESVTTGGDDGVWKRCLL